MRVSKTSSALLLAASASATPVAPQAAQPTHYIFSFGDSYSQTGFNVTTGPLPTCGNGLNGAVGNPPFPGYTTTNGVNWIDQVVESSPGCILNFNFAYGGATINASLVTPYEPTVLSFIDQVTEFTNSVARKPKGYKWTASNTAAAFWFGVNDVGNSWYYSNYSDINAADLNSFYGQLDILYDAGVRKFLLLTVPPTDRSPLFISSGAATVKGVKHDIPQWNKRLSSQAGAWSFEHEDAQVAILDTFPIFTEILNHPRKYGAPNATCYNSDGVSCLWWNSYHPGQAIQKAVGNAAYGMLYGKGSLGLTDSA